MKKILSFLLIAIMLVACLVIMASCGRISENDLENDPFAVVNEAVNKSMNEFFEDKSGFSDVLKKAAEKGKYTVSFASDDLMGGELTEVSETVWLDKKNSSFVSKTAVNYNGEKLSAFIYGQKDKIAFESNAVLGDTSALLFDPKTFAEKLDGSALAELMEIAQEDISELKEIINSVFDESRLDTEENSEKLTALYNELYAMMDQSVSTEKAEDADGKEKKYIVSTYSITNENLKSMLERMYGFALDELGETAEENAELKTEFDAMLAELDESVTLDLKLSLYIDGKSGSLYMILVDGDMVITEEEYDYVLNENTWEYEEIVTGTVDIPCEIDLKLAISESEITVKADVAVDGESVGIDVSLEKEAERGDVTYELSAKLSMGSIEMKLLSATYEYEKNGDITVKVDLPAELGASISGIVLRGELKVERKSATLTFNRLKIGETEYKFDLSFKAEAVDEIPAIPSDAKDIVSITAEEWENIAASFENSKLAELIASFDIPQDDDYYDEYDYDAYEQGRSDGYDAGTNAGVSDAENGTYTEFDIDYDLYWSDAYYEGYCDGYTEGYEEAYDKASSY